uniref:Genome polyprotein n=1 Tax=Avocet calicivirus TaxID=2212749 RepID=A0A3G1RP86_9CALI|nr:MAG: polyprotein [Avocet calicivirus]
MNGWGTNNLSSFLFLSSSFYADTINDFRLATYCSIRLHTLCLRSANHSTCHYQTSKMETLPKPSEYALALEAFGCAPCAKAYLAYRTAKCHHRGKRGSFQYGSRLAEKDHERTCKSHSLSGPDPLQGLPADDFWRSIRTIETNTTNCHLCAAIYTAAYYRTGISYEEWCNTRPIGFAIRRHSPNCAVIGNNLELQGGGPSRMAGPPTSRQYLRSTYASTPSGPADESLLTTIAHAIGDENITTDGLISTVSKMAKVQNPKTTLAQAWRQFGADSATDRAVAMLTAVTLWANDNRLMEDHSATLSRLQRSTPAQGSWTATLKAKISVIEDWFKARGFYHHLRAIMEVTSELLSVFANGHQSIDALLQAMKPIPLMALILTWDGTPLGFATLLFGVLQLYGLLDADTISGCAHAVVEALAAFAERVFPRMNDLHPDIEPQSTTAFAAAFGCMIVVWVIGHLPRDIAGELKRAAATATSLLALFKIAKLAFDLARKHITTRHVNNITDRVLQASIDVVKPAQTSSASNRRAQMAALKKLQEEISTHMVKLDYAPHAVTLKALNATITQLIVRLNMIEGQGAHRNPPVGVVLCGPPGIGKTTLAMHLLDKVNPDVVHSNFTMHVDHHDSYSGEDTCLWDEFDTDPNANFVEGVIGIFNRTAYPLNNDLAENKGRVFTSKFVVMTSNTDTPVQPDHPRAHAFYRRLIFFDVKSPALERFARENPGVDPPPALFQDDFSHLTITRRPFLAYNSKGDTLEGTRVTPIRCSIAAVVKEVTARLDDFEPQSAPKQAIGLIVPKELAADVRTELLHKFTTNNSFVKLFERRGALTTQDLANPRGGHTIVTSEVEDPLIDDWYVVTNVNQAMSDLNTMLGLCPKLPHDVNMGFRTRLFRSVIHSGALPPSALPPSATYECKRLGDFIAVLGRVYGSSMLPILVKIAGKVELKSWTAFFASLADLTWGHNYHAYSIHTETGVFTIYTHEYMSVFCHTKDNEWVQTAPQPPPASALTTWDLFKSICRSICRIFVSHLNAAATATALVYYARLINAQPQTGGRGQVRNYQAGVALSDQEYDTWREYNTRVDARATVNDFIAARESLARNAPITSERVSQLARWLQARAPNDLEPQTGGYADFTRPLLRADGTRCGWAVHIGNGRYAVNTHGLDDAHSIDGAEFTILRRSANDISVVTSAIIPHAATLGQGPPVRAWDNRTCHNVYEHDARSRAINTTGWVAHVAGGSYKGDCGLPYFNSIGQVCGIHSGLYTGTRQAVISKFDCNTKPPTTWRGLQVENSGLMLGPLRKGTAYVRSVAHPTRYSWEDTEPAPYGGADPRNLMTQEKILANQLVPYLEPSLPIHPVVPEAADYVARHLRALLSFTPAPQIEPLTLALRRLDLTTTCGPFVPGLKKEYFAMTPDGPVMKPGTELSRHLDSTLAIASTGQPVCHAYQLALKDELLPTRKVVESRKRLLWGTDVGIVTLAAMVWGQLLDNLKSVVVASPIAVGCQMDSTYPATIVAQIQDKHTLCLDYRKWDSTMHPEVIHAAVNILCDMVPNTPLTESLRKTLTSQPVGYFMDKKITALRGLPSGMPATSVVNSVCHCIYFVSSLWLGEDSVGIARTRDPLSRNRIWTYGDDCIYALEPRAAAIYDQIIESAKILGLSPTAADKTQNYVLDGTLSFLKRDIIPLNDLVVARLDLGSILRQAVWVRCGHNSDHTVPRLPTDTTTRTVQIQEALLALALHGPETYSRWTPLFQNTIQAEGLLCEVEPWETCMMLYRSRYFTADPYSNQLLAEGDMQTNSVQNELEFQNGPGDSNSPSSSSPTGNADAAAGGTVQTSYTPSSLVAATAGGPVPESAALAMLGAGAPSTLPEGVAGLFVSSARFTWNNSQPVRTILGTVTLSPDANPFLKLLASMYAGWSGGMQVRIQISGSGMYGGRLIATIVPPGVNPTDVQNPTAYPHVIIDARVPEPVELYLPDIRRAAYHTTEAQSDPTTTLLITVSSPLLNPFAQANSTTSAVEVTVYTTPAPDFSFCLLTEPRETISQVLDVLGNSTALWESQDGSGALTSFVTQTSIRWEYNHYAANGTTTGWGNTQFEPIVLDIVSPPAISGSIIWKFMPLKVRPVQYNVDDFPWPDSEIPPALPPYMIATNLSSDVADTLLVGSGFTVLPFKSNYSQGVDGNFGFETARNACFLYGKRTDSDQNGGKAIRFTGYEILNPDGSLYINMNCFDPDMSHIICFPSIFYTRSGLKISTLMSPNARFGTPTPGNSMISFQNVAQSFPNTSAKPNPYTFHTSQPLNLARALLMHPPSFSDSMMAVFRLTNNSQSFEVGLRADGYMMTGGDANTTVALTEPFEITFTGYVPVTSRLVGPKVPARKRTWQQ